MGGFIPGVNRTSVDLRKDADGNRLTIAKLIYCAKHLASLDQNPPNPTPNACVVFCRTEPKRRRTPSNGHARPPYFLSSKSFNRGARRPRFVADGSSAMFVVLRSALEYWRWIRPIETGLGPRWAPNNDVPVSHDYPTSKAHAVDACMPSDSDVSAALRKDLHTLSVPVHVAVSARRARCKSPLKIPHLLLADLPEGSFACVSNDVQVSTPEHLFVHMATLLGFEELVWLGSELCNRYCAIHPDGEGLLPARPLTATKLLASYLDRAAGMRGYQNAQKALPYVLDNSASPMETVVAMLLCLPLRHGGYGLPAPVLNSWMCVEGHQRREVGQSHYACDLLWPDAKLALEYDGEQSHTGLNRIAQDSERRNDLHHLDITVLSITKRQLGSAESFDRTARQIAKRLGMRLRLDECRYDWPSRHAALRDKLLPGGMKLEF